MSYHHTAAGVTLVVDGGMAADTAYEDAIENGGNWVSTGHIVIEPDVVLWVYDGQHRRAGLRRLVDEI